MYMLGQWHCSRLAYKRYKVQSLPTTVFFILFDLVHCFSYIYYLKILVSYTLYFELTCFYLCINIIIYVQAKLQCTTFRHSLAVHFLYQAECSLLKIPLRKINWNLLKLCFNTATQQPNIIKNIYKTFLIPSLQRVIIIFV